MNIGFDAKRAFNNKTGLGNYSRFILNNLINSELRNNIFAYTPKMNNSNLFEFPKNQVKTNSSNWPNWYWRSVGIVSELKKDGISIFQGLSNEIPFGLKKANIKSIVSIHDLIFLRYPQYYPLIDRKVYDFKFKFACQNSDKIIAISQQTKDDIMDFYGIEESKIEVIYQSCSPRFVPNDVDDPLFKEKYKLYRPYIICVGTIEERKNQLALVQAFNNKKFEEFDLYIIGNGGDYKKGIEKYILENKIKNIILLNKIDNDDLIKFYQFAEFSAYISLFEGFGIPVLESISANVPVLASNNKAIMEAGGNCAYYVDPLSTKSIEEGLEELFFNKELRINLMANKEEHLEKFNDAKLTEQLINLYKLVENEI